MATLRELRDERLRKRQELLDQGVKLYPAQTQRSHSLQQIIDQFDQLEGSEAVVVGRVESTRKFGKIAFFVVRDNSARLQLFFKHDHLQAARPEVSEISYDQLNLLDPGDFIEARGEVIKTQTGELSLQVRTLRLLTKSLRPLPTAQDGFTNKEERMRRRYVDIAVNQPVYERYLRRSAFWQATRTFLLERSFHEIAVPVLESIPGGADAKPFVTHMDALDHDFYLRISHELPLKRLLGGGYEKVFDIGPRFRNENYSDEHLPEHIAMEWYWAYADWQDGMKLTQELVRFVADQTWGRRTFTLSSGAEIDLGADGSDWERVSFVDLLQRSYGLDVHTCSLGAVQASLREHNIEVEQHDNRVRGIDKLWKKIRTEIAGPVFLVDVPTFLQPLAKTQAADERLSEQFNLILAGTETCKAYSELNDPMDQLERFKEQQALRDAGDDEAQMLDIDFVEMLEYGMPPACGFGYSERLFWLLEGVTAREGVPFPQLRHEVSETTREIYPDLQLG